MGPDTWRQNAARIKTLLVVFSRVLRGGHCLRARRAERRPHCAVAQEKCAHVVVVVSRAVQVSSCGSLSLRLVLTCLVPTLSRRTTHQNCCCNKCAALMTTLRYRPVLDGSYDGNVHITSSIRFLTFWSSFALGVFQLKLLDDQMCIPRIRCKLGVPFGACSHPRRYKRVAFPVLNGHETRGLRLGLPQVLFLCRSKRYGGKVTFEAVLRSRPRASSLVRSNTSGHLYFVSMMGSKVSSTMLSSRGS